MKVLVIGLGSIARKHIEAIQQININTEILAFRSNAESKSNILGVKDIYTLDDVDFSTLRFILISNPTSEHFSTIQKLAVYQIPMFIEKPLFAKTDTQTQALVDEIEIKEISTYVACNLRFLESVQKLKELMKDQAINEVNVYCGSYLPDWRPNVDFRTVYSANKEMGGGVHIDLIHELDYVYWLFGKPSRTHSFFSNSSSLNISAYDYANYLWHYEKFSASIILNYYRKDPKRSIEVLTDEGTYTVDLLENVIDFNNKRIFASQKKVSDTYHSQMRFFIKNVLGMQEKFNTISEANTILKLCIQD